MSQAPLTILKKHIAEGASGTEAQPASAMIAATGDRGRRGAVEVSARPIRLAGAVRWVGGGPEPLVQY